MKTTKSRLLALKRLRRLTLALIVLALQPTLYAQHSQPDILTAHKTASAIKLDGVLDEPDWSKAPHISNFTQRELDENQPATEKTGR